jgi:hypothetical protein
MSQKAGFSKALILNPEIVDISPEKTGERTDSSSSSPFPPKRPKKGRIGRIEDEEEESHEEADVESRSARLEALADSQRYNFYHE